MYTNILQQDTTHIIHNILSKDKENMADDIQNMLQTVLHLEHNQVYNLLIKHQIIGYFRYVDDILIIYDKNKTHIDIIMTEFNKIHPTLNFTIEN
jgi:hypothetical protein